MKILIVAPSLSKKWGGTTTSVLNYYSGLLHQDDIQITVVTTTVPDEKKDVDGALYKNDDFLFFSCDGSSWRFSFQYMKYLKAHIKEFDLVWIHGLWTGTSYFASRYARKYRIPYVLTLHGMILPDAVARKSLKKSIYWNLIERKTCDHANLIHCVTKQEAQYSTARSGGGTFVQPNGVQMGEFIKKAFDKLEYICFIGRIHPIKGVDSLLKALPMVEGVRLLIAGCGEDDYEVYIRELADELQLGDRVEFVGFADEKVKYNLFEKSLFSVVPSYSEVLSMVALESIAKSTPVLITRQCNFDEIEGYGAGIIIDDNSPESIAQGIKLMLEHDLEKMSQNAYRLASEKYEINSVAREMLSMFENVVASAKSPH